MKELRSPYRISGSFVLWFQVRLCDVALLQPCAYLRSKHSNIDAIAYACVNNAGGGLIILKLLEQLVLKGQAGLGQLLYEYSFKMETRVFCLICHVFEMVPKLVRFAVFSSTLLKLFCESSCWSPEAPEHTSAKPDGKWHPDYSVTFLQRSHPGQVEKTTYMHPSQV